jgi:hypothetical protein
MAWFFLHLSSLLKQPFGGQQAACRGGKSWGSWDFLLPREKTRTDSVENQLAMLNQMYNLHSISLVIYKKDWNWLDIWQRLKIWPILRPLAHFTTWEKHEVIFHKKFISTALFPTSVRSQYWEDEKAKDLKVRDQPFRSGGTKQRVFPSSSFCGEIIVGISQKRRKRKKRGGSAEGFLRRRTVFTSVTFQTAADVTTSSTSSSSSSSSPTYNTWASTAQAAEWNRRFGHF